MSQVLAVTGLTVGYRNSEGDPIVVVINLDLSLEGGRILGLAGESGCGKSTAALAAIGFPIPGSVLLGGSAAFEDRDLLAVPMVELRRIWGRKIAYVAQDASLALNPLHRVERLLRDPLAMHLGLDSTSAHERSVELLDQVGIPDPERALRRYPHQFSGGQQQRIALAIAMSCRPAVLVLDEPTTGLDVTTQAQISQLIAELVSESGTAALAISHDLALLATICDEIAIMYAGEIVERAPAATVYSAARHPYAAALIDAAPRIDESVPMIGIPGLPPPAVVVDRCAFAERCRFVAERCWHEYPALLTVADGHQVRCLRTSELGEIPSNREMEATPARGQEASDGLLVVEDLVCSYQGAQDPPAVGGISLHVQSGETVAVVGESGSGKSTLLRAVAGLHRPDSGTVLYHGVPLQPHAAKRTREIRRTIQLVFQNPHSSLNPRHTVASIIDRPLVLFRPELNRSQRAQRVRDLLADVRLDEGLLGRYPAQLSGGQKQRVALARAFAAEPELILGDEVVSALDVSVQASILELLENLAREHHVAVLFVTHDLAVVRSIADRIYVMRHGTIREHGTAETILANPEDAYTQALLAAVPRPGGTCTAPPGAASQAGGRGEWHQ